MLAEPEPLVPDRKQPRPRRGGWWKKLWKGIGHFAKSKWPGLHGAFVLGCTLTFFSMQIYFVPSEKLALHDENAELKRTNKDLAEGIAIRNERIRQLTVPEPQPLTWHEIEDGYAKRAGRGAEQESFAKRYVDKEVDWEIILEQKLSGTGWGFYYSEKGSRFSPNALFKVQFVTDSPASSLKRGDKIEVRGKLAMFDETQLEIDEATYEFLAPGPTPK
jgi:hypothetical protein